MPRTGSTRRRSRRPGTVVMATTEEPTARDRAVRHQPKQEAKPMAEEVPLAYAICRSLQHGWVHRLEPVRGVNEVGFESQCSSCGTVRTKYIHDRTGAIRNVYTYPTGYQAKPGDDRLQPHEWRMNLLRRI